MIPHFDIQGHSVSVEWPVRNNETIIGVDVNTTASWKLVLGTNSSADCFILKDELENSEIQEEEEDDPLLASSRICTFVAAERTPWLFVEPIRDLVRLDMFTWLMLLVSVLSAHMLMTRVNKERVVGVVRVSYTDSSKSAEYTALPNPKFPISALTESSIVKKLLETPGYSSFTVVTAHPL